MLTLQEILLTNSAPPPAQTPPFYFLKAPSSLLPPEFCALCSIHLLGMQFGRVLGLTSLFHSDFENVTTLRGLACLSFYRSPCIAFLILPFPAYCFLPFHAIFSSPHLSIGIVFSLLHKIYRVREIVACSLVCSQYKILSRDSINIC